MKTNKANLITVSGLLLGVAFSPVATAAGGFFVGAGYPQVEIGGDMDGESFVAGGGSAEILPDQDDGTGVKYLIGYYVSGGTFELSWVDTDHDGDWLGLETDSSYRSLNMDIKLPVGAEHRLRGQVILGVGFTSVEIENGSTDGFREQDATFNGLDFRFGLGLAYELSERFILQGSLVKRYGSYDEVEGIVDGDLDDDLDGDGTTLSFELLYLFPA